MAVERTISIIKPDAVGKNVIGEIYSRFEKAGLRVIAARMKHLSTAEAEGFYAVHRERPFFRDLVDFMTSGPVMIQVLEGENAVSRNRELMGATALDASVRDAAVATVAKVAGGFRRPFTASYERATARGAPIAAAAILITILTAGAQADARAGGARRPLPL